MFESWENQVNRNIWEDVERAIEGVIKEGWICKRCAFFKRQYGLYCPECETAHSEWHKTTKPIPQHD